MRIPTIVVATDGAASSHPTVRWAVVAAGRRHMNLRVVHVLDGAWSTGCYDLGSNARPRRDHR